MRPELPRREPIKLELSSRRCCRTIRKNTRAIRRARRRGRRRLNNPSADSGGVTTNIGPGQYQYIFHTRAPSGFDASATHTIGIYGSRDLTNFDLGTNYASTTFNFVPNGPA